ncbi:MAG TPA: DUF5318 family protein [Acidimicrobiales bacterium]|nr:DUF5318 family protein [Acidimicrobiales bacterium]
MRSMPQSLAGSPAGMPTGLVDFRLARNAVISEFRKGRVSKDEICVAHPELLRAARSVGEATGEECPICEQAEVVLVSYAFGPRLPPSGQCVTSSAELTRLARRAHELACYVVEVCPECAWNHLARSFPVGHRRRS